MFVSSHPSVFSQAMAQLSPGRRHSWSVCQNISQTICRTQSLTEISLNNDSPSVSATSLILWIRHQIRLHQGSEIINQPGKLPFHQRSSNWCQDWQVLRACVKINMACMYHHTSHVFDQWTEILRLMSAFHCWLHCKLQECNYGHTTLAKLFYAQSYFLA